ncbi:MAG TPA: MFS transporter [Pyrinomonadaceae bacterium]|nr:MFS transporter [Pyrinomonadaceae bacterium]
MKRSPLAVIFVTVFIDLVGFGIVIPLLPFYASRFGASPFAIGLLFASYSLMQLVFSPVLGRLSDRHGRRPVLLLSLLGTALGFFILGFADTLLLLFVGRIIDGISGANISTAQAYVADVTTPENRAKGMGLVGAAFGLGFIFGPAIGGTLSLWGKSVPFFFAGALALANAVLLYFTLPETVTPDTAARTAAPARGLGAMVAGLRRPVFGSVLSIYFLFVVAFSIMTTTFALYTMRRFGYEEHHNGYLFAFIGVIAVVVQGGLIGRLVRRHGEMPFVIGGAALFVAGLAALPFVGPAAGGLAALLGVLAMLANGNAMATPSLQALASRSAGGGEQGLALGLTQSAASLARVVGPLIGGWLIGSASASSAAQIDDRSILVTFWTAGAITFAALLLAARLARKTSEVRGQRLEVSEEGQVTNP